MSVLLDAVRFQDVLTCRSALCHIYSSNYLSLTLQFLTKKTTLQDYRPYNTKTEDQEEEPVRQEGTDENQEVGTDENQEQYKKKAQIKNKAQMKTKYKAQMKTNQNTAQKGPRNLQKELIFETLFNMHVTIKCIEIVHL